MNCRSTITGSGVRARWIYFRARSVKAAKTAATKEWGYGMIDHVITLQIAPDDQALETPEDWDWSDKIEKYTRPIKSGRWWN